MKIPSFYDFRETPLLVTIMKEPGQQSSNSFSLEHKRTAEFYRGGGGGRIENFDIGIFTLRALFSSEIVL